MILVHQYRGMDLARAFFLEVLDDRVQGVTFVENVVEHQHHPVAQVLARPNPPVEHGALQRVAIAGGVQVGDLERKVETWQQPAGEDQPPFMTT